MNAKPLHDRVVVKRVEADNITPGGIIIPETAKEKPVEGIVIAVGEGRRNTDGTVTPLTVKEGDRVLYGRYAGTEIKVEGEEHLIIREDDIMLILEGVDASKKSGVRLLSDNMPQG